MRNIEIIKDKLLGCLYGQAIGDALGFGTENMLKSDVEQYYPNGLVSYDQIVQDERRKGWPIGMWTDDTEMMLAILDYFVNSSKMEVDTSSLALYFLEFYEKWGFTCGTLTRKVLNFAPPVYMKKPIAVSKMVWELKGKDNAPNGGLMRTSIVGLWPYNVTENLISTCQMTHYDPRCVCSCVVIGTIIYNLVWRNRYLTLEELCEIGKRYDNKSTYWIKKAHNNCDIECLKLGVEEAMAYTYKTMASALWAYFHIKDFESGLLKIVNEGGDADTNAAVACAILGAKFGYNAISKYYIDNLYNENEYKAKCEKFINLAIDSIN